MMWTFCSIQISIKNNKDISFIEIISLNILKNLGLMDEKNDYFEYFLGNLGFMGEKMFIMCMIGWWELVQDVDHDVVHAFNKMRVNFKVQVEWGFGGLKRKWRCFMKNFNSTKPRYTHLFWVAIFYINFLHTRHMDLTFDMVGDWNPNQTTHDYRRNFS